MELVLTPLALAAVGLAVGLAAHFIYRRFQRKPPHPLTDAAIERVALEGDTITAIRWHRELHNSSLPVAKAAVEGMVAQGREVTQ